MRVYLPRRRASFAAMAWSGFDRPIEPHQAVFSINICTIGLEPLQAAVRIHGIVRTRPARSITTAQGALLNTARERLGLLLRASAELRFIEHDLKQLCFVPPITH